MPTPNYRVPVIVGRGTKTALDSALADLQEGELVCANDENSVYVVEGGVLTQASTVFDPTTIEIVNDTTPQLGGDLDVQTHQIVSTSGRNIQIAPDTDGVLEARGNSGNDAAIQLNCETNGHGVKIKSPPHSAAATYTLVLPNDTGTSGQALTTDGSGNLAWATPSTVGSINDLTDVDTTSAAPTDGQALIWNNVNGEWVPGNVVADIGSTSIDALVDVDTTSVAPTDGQVLVWSASDSEWIPGDQTGDSGGVTSILAGAGISIDQSTGDVTVTATGGGGGGSATGRLTESQTASSGAATFTELGHSGTLVDVTSSLDAWITLYGSAASRTSDASRSYSTDPTPGSGVLAEFYITAGSTIAATPGTTYFNSDTSSTEALYLAVRDQSGAAVDSAVTIISYGNQAITSISGGTFGSGI